MQRGYREQPAPNGLRGVVACLWQDETATLREQRVLPDGCIDLIWMDGAVHVAGPDTTAFLVTHRPGRPITGLRFHPGAGPAVLGLPAHLLRDQRVRLDELRPGIGWAQRIADSPPAGLAAVVAQQVARTGVVADPALREVLTRLRAGCGVAATAAAVGWTERALHRRCRDTFGYGPSVLRRILRFRVALRLAQRGVPFATVAARAGFADQAHLAREVRALAGAPLSHLLQPPRT